tara:strand:+ start:232 stop:423 length:192 start_codon:yes stop_codon:yes gene_type:complete
MESDFAQWEAGQPYTTAFEATTTGCDVSVLFDTSDDYRLVISNRTGTTSTACGILANVFWQNP